MAPLGTLVGSEAGRREATNASSVMPAAGSATTARGASRLGAGSGARPSGRSLGLVNSSRVHPALLSSARKDGGRAKPRPRSASGRHGSMMRESEGVQPSRVTRPLGRCSQGEEHPTSRNRLVTSYSDMRWMLQSVARNRRREGRQGPGRLGDAIHMASPPPDVTSTTTRCRASLQKLLSYTDLAMLDRLVNPTDALRP